MFALFVVVVHCVLLFVVVDRGSFFFFRFDWFSLLFVVY